MPDLVTLEEVNAALRLDLEIIGDPSTDDPGEVVRIEDVQSKIAQASDIVRDFVTHTEKDYWTAETAPDRVKAATIMVVRCLLDDTEESLAMLSGLSGEDPASSRNPIVALLKRLRTPTLA